MSEALFVFVKKLHEQSVELLRDVRFNAGLQLDRLILGNYASMIEFCGAMIVLINGAAYVALPIVFRSFIEAYVHLKNGLADENYVHHYAASHAKFWTQLLEEREAPNPFLAEIHSSAARASALARHEEKLAELKAMGFPEVTVRTRFERVGLLHFYESVYKFESDSVHSSLQALSGRHFDLEDGRLTLSLYKQRSLENCEARLDVTAAALMDATQKIHERYNSGHEKEVGELSEELAKLRATDS